MNKAKLLLGVIVSIATFTAHAKTTWQSETEEYQKQFSAEKYDQAEKSALKALRLAKKEYGDESFCVAVCLNNLSLVCQKLNQPKESKQYFSEALKMTKDLVGSRDPEIAKALRQATQGNPNAGDPFADFNLNTLPWIKWGNSPMDRAPSNERLEKFYGAFLPAFLKESQ